MDTPHAPGSRAPQTDDDRRAAGVTITAANLTRALLSDVAAGRAYTGTPTDPRCAAVVVGARTLLDGHPETTMDLIAHLGRRAALALREVHGDGAADRAAANAATLRRAAPLMATAMSVVQVSVEALDTVPGDPRTADPDRAGLELLPVPERVRAVAAEATDPPELAVLLALLLAGLLIQASGFAEADAALREESAPLYAPPNGGQ